MKPTKASNPIDLQEEAFANLLEEITQAVEAGEAVDLAAYEAKYPDLAERLRRLVPALQVLDEIGLSAVRSSASGRSHRAPLSPIQGMLGDFRIVREIGRGGMGVVYEAEQISLGRRVALKVLPFAAILDPRHLQRFQNEARAAASLKHPHIVSVYSVGCERGVHYYAMEYVDGKTLANVIDELRASSPFPLASGRRASSPLPSGEGSGVRGEDSGQQADLPVSLAPPLPLSTTPRAANTKREPQAGVSTSPTTRVTQFFQTVARLGIQAAEALDHAHQMGIVHRDIKPSNLMVAESGESRAESRGRPALSPHLSALRLYVTDFGLAMTQQDAALTRTGDLLGTLRYMSPEQVRGSREVVDQRTDIYSLGITLYELLTLRPAFGGENREVILRRIAEDDPPPPRQVNGTIPRDLETIVLKATAKEPQARYATARELADDLQRFLADEPIRARPPSLADRGAKWARRHRTFVWSSIAILVTVSIVLALSTLLVLRERTETIRQRDEVISREAILRKHRYAADVHWAWLAYNLGEAAQAQKTLEQHRPLAGQEDLRSFAWHYLWQSCQTDSIALEGHTNTVYCVAFSADGKILASGGKDRTIVLWDRVLKKKLATLEGHSDDVNYAAFSPDGKVLATAGEDRTVKLWDVAGSRLLRTLAPFDFPVSWVCFAQGTKNLVVAEVDWNSHVGKTSLWDPDGGRRLWTLDGCRALSLSPDGRIAASAKCGRTLRILNVAAQKELASVELSNVVLTGAFGPDGRMLATGSRDRLVHLWNTVDLKQIAVLAGHFSAVRSVAFSPNGRVLVSAGDDGQVRFWEASSGRRLRVLGGHTGEVWCAAFAPDGRTLATASADRTVRLWAGLESLGVRILPRESRAVRGIAFLPDNRTLASVSGDSRVRFWDTETAQLASSIELSGKGLTCMAVSPCGQLLALGTSDGTIEVRDLTAPDRRIARFQQFGGDVQILVFSSDGLLLASEAILSPGQSGSTTLWDLQRRKERLTIPWSGPRHGTQRIAIAPDGKTLASVLHTEVTLFDLATGGSRSCPTGHRSYVKCVAYSPDGAVLATGGTDPKIELLDTETGQARTVLLGHQEHIQALAFSPDGKTLASASELGEVRLWDVFTGRELALLSRPRCELPCLAFSPDGTRLAVGVETSERLGEVEVWHAPRKETMSEK